MQRLQSYSDHCTWLTSRKLLQTDDNKLRPSSRIKEDLYNRANERLAWISSFLIKVITDGYSVYAEHQTDTSLSLSHLSVAVYSRYIFFIKKTVYKLSERISTTYIIISMRTKEIL